MGLRKTSATLTVASSVLSAGFNGIMGQVGVTQVLAGSGR